MDDQKGFVLTSTGELRMDCPFCEERTGKPPDTGKHLYINVKKDLYFCHRCDAKGKAQALNAFIHDIKSRRDYRDIIEQAKTKHQIKKSDRKYFNLDSVGKPIVEGTPSWLYLVNKRNLSPQEIRYYDLRSGLNEMRGRIIVPVFDEQGYCIYYSARSYNNRNPKYKNPKVDKKNVVFHLYGVTTEYVIVCEGVFSAIHAGRSAVAILGKYVSNPQYHLLARRFKTIYLALDGDELQKDRQREPKKKKIPKMVRRFKGLGCKVGVVELPTDQDPEDVVIQNGWEYFQKKVQDTPTAKFGRGKIVIRQQRRFYDK